MPESDSWVEPLLPLEVGQRVIAANGDERSPGTVTQKNDSDQGDFEYHVDHDDGTNSFWPRECLHPVETEVNLSDLEQAELLRLLVMKHEPNKDKNWLERVSKVTLKKVILDSCGPFQTVTYASKALDAYIDQKIKALGLLDDPA